MSLLAMNYPQPVLDYSVGGLQGAFNNIWQHYVVKGGHPGIRPTAANNGSVIHMPFYCSKGSKNADPISLLAEGKLAGKFGSLKFLLEEEPRKVAKAMGIFKPASKEEWQCLIDIQSVHDALARQHGPSPAFTTGFTQALVVLGGRYGLEIPSTQATEIEE